MQIFAYHQFLELLGMPLYVGRVECRRDATLPPDFDGPGADRGERLENRSPNFDHAPVYCICRLPCHHPTRPCANSKLTAVRGSESRSRHVAVPRAAR